VANSRNPSAITLIKENLSFAKGVAAINDDTIPHHCGDFRVGLSDQERSSRSREAERNP
jgi:hypothetical protein